MKIFINKIAKLNINTNYNKMYLSIFKTLFSSTQTYIMLIIVPIILSLFTYLFKTNLDNLYLNPAVISSILIIPCFGAMILSSSLLAEWRESVFLRRIRMAGISKMTFIICFYINILVFTFIAIFINWSLLTLADVFLSNKSVIGMWKEIKVGSFFILLLNFVIFILLSISISIIITGGLKSLVWAQVINILVIIFAYLTADLIFNPNVADDVNFYFNIGFISFFKYGTWTIMMSVANVAYHEYNIDIVMSGVTGKNLFNNLYTPMILLIIIDTSLIILSYITFRIGLK